MQLNKTKWLLPLSCFFMIGSLMMTACHSGGDRSGREGRAERVIPAYYKYFRGTMGDKKAIMQLIKYHDRYEGIVIIDSISGGKPLVLSGGKDSTDLLTLVSYDHYNAVDTFSGRFPQPGVFQGTCSDTAGRQAAFTLQEIYPRGTYHWDVYTLEDSLAFDSSGHDSPMARTRFMLLWPRQKNMTKIQHALLTDSIIRYYDKVDSALKDPAKVLQAADDSFLTQYKRSVNSLKESARGAITATFNWQSEVTMEILWNADSVVSMAFRRYEYTGGAHGLGNTFLMVFDMRQNKVLTMNDIFQPGYEHALQRVLEKQLRTVYDIPEGAPLNGSDGILFDQHLALTKNFYVTDKGVGFIYNPYEVAPYVVGQIELFVPFDEISGVVKNDLPFMQR